MLLSTLHLLLASYSRNVMLCMTACSYTGRDDFVARVRIQFSRRNVLSEFDLVW
jgi:hypothetical protein